MSDLVAQLAPALAVDAAPGGSVAAAGEAPGDDAPGGSVAAPGRALAGDTAGREAAAPDTAVEAAPRLLRIQEVAEETGLTTRSIRYYEEVGLLRPAARSVGSYRLYDASDVERLRSIHELRDDAGFSLAEIGRLLEDEDARIRDRARFRAAGDAAEKEAILRGLIARLDRQVGSLEAKSARLREMIDATTTRLEHLRAHLAELDGGPAVHEPGAPHPEAGP